MNTTPFIDEEKNYRGGTTIRICKSVALTPQAELAQEIMRQLAIVACVPDGEDSDGRQRFRLMTPEETAHRASEIATRAYEDFESRGWLVPLPQPKPATLSE